MVTRAKEILRQIENGEMETGPAERPAGEPFESEDGQMTLLPAADNALLQKLKELDVNTLTPIEAMQTLYELCREAAAY